MTRLPQAIVLGGQETALAVVRSLGARGVRVLVSGLDGGLAGRSRFCSASSPYRDPARAAEHWSELLLRSRGPAGSVLLPTCDEALDFIARNHAALGERYLLDMHRPELHLALLDKRRTLELGRAAGVRTPSFWSVSGAEDLQRALDEVRYPALIKPIHSHAFRAVFGRKHFAAHEPDELVRDARRALDAGQPFMLCEMIPGPDSLLSSYYTYLTPQGERLFDFTKRILRRHPLNEGGATHHLTQWLPRTAEAGRTFFEGIGFRGLGNVEFKLDRRDGELKLIECNARFTAAQALIARAGIDTAWLSYRRAAGMPVERIEGYRENLCLWSPFSDFRAFRELRRQGRLSTAAWLASVVWPPIMPQLAFDDPVPGLAVIAGALRAIVSRRWARASGFFKRAAAQ